MPAVLRRALAPIVFAAACTPTAPEPPRPAPLPPPVASGRPSLGLSPAETAARYRETRPAQLKLRHQVETRFMGRSEVVEGHLLYRLPERFWVRATTPFGGTLFDVKTTPGGALAVEVSLSELERAEAPRYLARDIQRIYLFDCPAHTPARSVGGLVAVRCVLPPSDTITPRSAPPDPGDDAVTLWLDGAAFLVRKSFERDGKPTAVIDYLEPREVQGVALAGRIVLMHQQVDYRITVQLLDADPGFDVAAQLDRATGDGGVD